ncbi:hypothetical protein FEM48_Zijuj04G0181500 [Ziziphus jujuba var. spinosa]|uniref:Uncharacterized protein n=1 Tax=Ziziphus jujuba var. spinosa TaxID=714518 RepID=A0A978VLE0_ZIZJJ|nr:hypothetical protein FEM48_Zijuj04G0181500 [Ziziphus jujuba var. spinosa]
MASFKTLTLDCSNLFLAAQTSFFHQPPPPLSFSPFPTTFPQSKLIPKTRCDHSISYFLSHFHSNHYTDLSPNWSKGVVFCSQTTAKLLIEVLKVPSQFIVPLPFSEPVVIALVLFKSFSKFWEIMVEKGYTRAVGFVPTMWTFEVKRNKFSVRPNFFVVSMMSLRIGRRFSAINADEDLEMGNVYVMFPMKSVNSVVTASDMGALFITANSATKQRVSGGKVKPLPVSRVEVLSQQKFVEEYEDD